MSARIYSKHMKMGPLSRENITTINCIDQMNFSFDWNILTLPRKMCPCFIWVIESLT